MNITIKKAKQHINGKIAIEEDSETNVAKSQESVKKLSDLKSQTKVNKLFFGIIVFNIRNYKVNIKDEKIIITYI